MADDTRGYLYWNFHLVHDLYYPLDDCLYWNFHGFPWISRGIQAKKTGVFPSLPWVPSVPGCHWICRGQVTLGAHSSRGRLGNVHQLLLAVGAGATGIPGPVTSGDRAGSETGKGRSADHDEWEKYGK